MRTTALSALVLLGASLVASSPIRVVVTTHQELSSNVHYGALPDSSAAHVAFLPHFNVNSNTAALDGSKQTHHGHAHGRQPCSSMRAKALDAMNRFRALLGLSPIDPHEGLEQSHQPVRILPIFPDVKMDAADAATEPLVNTKSPAPILPFVGTPVRPAFAQGEDGWVGRPGPYGRMHRMHRHHGNFLRRVHHALMALGPWEGRAVAFVLGCGIGVLLRMMWVMVLVTARAIRGSRDSDSDERDGYDVVFDDEADLYVPPPQYTTVVGDEVVPATAAAEEKAEEKEKA
ncbi:hypothetical protein BD413DRAFT_219154 [Trametes elegans]|nr:hypothetical protein BD413DRAFT_219154 [Trametes elegans]